MFPALAVTTVRLRLPSAVVHHLILTTGTTELPQHLSVDLLPVLTAIRSQTATDARLPAAIPLPSLPLLLLQLAAEPMFPASAVTTVRLRLPSAVVLLLILIIGATVLPQLLSAVLLPVL